jgi:glutathione S-transferase
MIPVLFYGVPEGCSFGSIVLLEWSGLDYRLCRIEMPSVVSSDAYRRINPVAETPALLTGDGRFVSQSFAIIQSVGAACPEAGLVPSAGTRLGDRFNEVLAFLNTNFFESFAPLWYALESGATGAEAETLRAMGRAKVIKAHDDLERMLAGSTWLAGTRTAADAYFYGLARWNDYHRVVDRRAYPAVSRLLERLAGDPSVRFAHAIEHAELVNGANGFKGHVSLDDMQALIDATAAAQE